MSKAMKYSLFDISKEMAFTPLDPEVQWNAKASIDGIVTNLGKTGSSITYQTLLIVFGSISAAAPFIAGLLLITILGWFIATSYTNKIFKKLTLKN